jgi:hypothetical protein
MSHPAADRNVRVLNQGWNDAPRGQQKRRRLEFWRIKRAGGSNYGISIEAPYSGPGSDWCQSPGLFRELRCCYFCRSNSYCTGRWYLPWRCCCAKRSQPAILSYLKPAVIFSYISFCVQSFPVPPCDKPLLMIGSASTVRAIHPGCAAEPGHYGNFRSTISAAGWRADSAVRCYNCNSGCRSVAGYRTASGRCCSPPG